MPAAAIIGAAGSLLASGMSNMFAQNNADISYARQKELMALQQKYAVENWNREANYNDPKEQMKRLKEAGLNPNLVYSNGSAGLQAPSTAAPTAPSAPMAQTIPFGNAAADAAQAALAINQAKKAGAEAIGQDIQNQYLDERCRKEIDQIIQDIAESGSRVHLNEETKANLAQATSNLMLEADALKTRLGYEEVDRLISMYEAVTNRLVAANKIADDAATRYARIFSMMAQGRLADANAYVIGLFKDPKKAKAWLEGWASTIKETWNDLFGDDKNDEGKDSKGRGTLNPLNKNPKSKAAKFARSFFGALDYWTSTMIGDEPAVLK